MFFGSVTFFEGFSRIISPWLIVHHATPSVRYVNELNHCIKLSQYGLRENNLFS